VLEYYLVETDVLPWSLALGILCVFLLVLVNNKLIPEFGEFVFSFANWLEDLFRRKQSAS